MPYTGSIDGYYYTGPIDDYCFEHLLNKLLSVYALDEEFYLNDVCKVWVHSKYPDDFVEEWEGLSEDDKSQVVEDLLKAAREALTPSEY
jgi:hypothetical protein